MTKASAEMIAHLNAMLASGEWVKETFWCSLCNWGVTVACTPEMMEVERKEHKERHGLCWECAK